MATRAYKIAEELGIERNEFVEKVRDLGVELRNAMAPLDDEQVALVREKLGRKQRAVTEARVERKGGAIIRRRKRTVAKPAPEAPPAEEEAAAAEVAPEAPAAEVAPAAEPAAPAPEAPAVEAPAPEPEAVEPAAAAAEEAPVAPAAEQAAATPAEIPTRPRAEAEQEEAARGEGRPARPGTPSSDTAPDRKGQKKKQFREVVNLREQEQIARQVTSRTTGRPAVPEQRAFQNPRRRRRDAVIKPRSKPAAAKAPKPQKRVARVEGQISVAELAKQLGAKAAEIQGKLMAFGTMVSINQLIDLETAERVAGEYGFEVQDVGFQEQAVLDAGTEASGEENLRPRPPVVTVMGHVDHGKTSLLDALRKTNVVAGEAGGITQHIGAYQVDVNGHLITFIDTPGHAAFTAMRARGAEATDIVILVVAASEGVMPQTKEAISHAKAAGVPLIVAVNKCDLPDANPAITRQRLMEHEVVVEDFGGDVLAVDISATQGTNLDKLLEAVLLQSELLEPKADPTVRAKGVVLESRLDKGRGAVATVLVQEGTLERGDVIVAGTSFGRVRSMLNERGEQVKKAGPSTPVEVIGLNAAPDAGEAVHCVENERAAKEVVSHREDQARQQAKVGPSRPRVNLEELFAQAEGGGPRELNLIIKADTQGSAEALRDALLKIPSDKVNLKVLQAAVGGVSESDVQLAKASDAIIVGFHVRPEAKARRLADQEGIDVRSYQIIYEVVDEVRAAMAGLLPPTVKEVMLGEAEVRQTFNIPKVGTICGSYVVDGTMKRGAGCRLLRDGVQVYEGRFSSLKRFKDDVREVQSGFECGIGLEGFNDIKVGDRIQAYELEEQPAEL